MAAFAAATTSLVDIDCGNDWLQIPCASDQMNSVYTKASVASPTGPTLGCVNKLCGVFFSAVTAATSSAPVYSKLLSCDGDMNNRTFFFLMNTLPLF
jgi:hypothetical protein